MKAEAFAGLRTPRRESLDHAQDRALAVLLVTALILLAQGAAQGGLVSSLILPPPTTVWAALVDGFSSGLYWFHLGSTLWATGIGFVLAAIVSLVIAALVTSAPRFERVVMPLIVAFQSLPKIAIAPLVILWLGFDQESKVLIVVISSFFPILVNGIQGLRLRNREYYELMAGLGASRVQILRYVRLPDSLPYVFAGFHVGLNFALLGAVVAEFVGAPNGLGYVLLQQKAQFNVAGVYAILVILMVVGLALRQVTLQAEKRVAFWAGEVSATSIAT